MGRGGVDAVYMAWMWMVVMAAVLWWGVGRCDVRCWMRCVWMWLVVMCTCIHEHVYAECTIVCYWSMLVLAYVCVLSVCGCMYIYMRLRVCVQGRI